MITNSTEAKELLLMVATALESPSTGWSDNAIAKVRWLAEQVEKDLGAGKDFEELDEISNSVILDANERKRDYAKFRQSVRTLEGDIDELLVGLMKNYSGIIQENAALKAEVERLKEILAEMVDAFPFLHNLKQTDAAILACKALGRIKEDGRE
jgi:regulator of replication initiation timing